MKDLYQRLGVPPYADDVRATIAQTSTDAKLRADAEGVLLVPRHRQAYDRSHRLLTTVGQLRRRLDLHLRPFWARSGNQDFTASAPHAHADSVSLARALGGRAPRRSRWIWAAIATAVAVVAVFALWKLRAHHAAVRLPG